MGEHAGIHLQQFSRMAGRVAKDHLAEASAAVHLQDQVRQLDDVTREELLRCCSTSAPGTTGLYLDTWNLSPSIRKLGRGVLLLDLPYELTKVAIGVSAVASQRVKPAMTRFQIGRNR